MSDDEPRDATPSADKSRRLTLSLPSLYLDPNNYRFIDHADYRPVADDQVTDDEVQRRTRQLVVGVNAENVSDLIASFQQNGWLDVEPIHVRKLADRKYLVVEGNRRVATLKYLLNRWEAASGHLGKLDRAVFDKVPCIVYDERDTFHNLVVMGLHHISGKRRWPAINQARLMKRLRDDFGKDPDEICASLGVSKREFNLSIRTLALADTYVKSDYGDQFSSEMFNLFREVLRAPALRGWLRWDDAAERAGDPANLERLFSLLSRESDDEDDEDGAPGATGTVAEPAITTGAQVRELAKIIDDPAAVKLLEESRSLQTASISSGALVRNEIDGAIQRSHQDAERLFGLAPKMSSTDLDRIDSLTDRLKAIAVSRKRQPASETTSQQPWPIHGAAGPTPGPCFRAVRVERYRAVQALPMNELGRVNLLVGINNTGKTTLLEAIYLLAQQSDPRALLEIVRRRTRIDPASSPAFTVSQLVRGALVSGRHGTPERAVTVATEVLDQPVNPDEDWATYLRTLVVSASYGDVQQKSVTDFFAGRSRRTQLEGEPRWLCPAVLHSPFSLADPELLVRCNEASIRAKSKERVIAFVRKHVDAGIRDIALASEHSRFLVTHDRLREAVDLATFGEGVQRILLAGLLFAEVRGGVLLIDEFENALHTSVLSEFTKFIHELAVDFNVQVFLTTHSKETVDAFLLNGYRPEEVVAFLLKQNDRGARTATRFAGPTLKRAIEVGDVDLRRL